MAYADCSTSEHLDQSILKELIVLSIHGNDKIPSIHGNDKIASQLKC